MTSTNDVGELEDLRTNAIRRLVQGILGRPFQDPRNNTIDQAVALASRILQSSIGSNISSQPRHHRDQIENDDTGDTEAALTWRRIEQRLIQQRGKLSSSSSTHTIDDILKRSQSLYQEFQKSIQGTSETEMLSQIPIQMLEILSQLNDEYSTSNTHHPLLRHDDQQQFIASYLNPRQEQAPQHPRISATNLPNNVPPLSSSQYNDHQTPLSSSTRPVYDHSNPELVLLQECFYCLQGISGDLLFFGETANGRNRMLCLNRDRATDKICSWLDASSHHHNDNGGSSGAMDALRICGEAGFLCQRIQCFIDSILSSPSPLSQPTWSSSSQPFTAHPQITAPAVGAVAKSLALALQEQLQEYHAFLARLESKMLRAIEDHDQYGLNRNENSASSVIPTLRWLYAELQEPTRQLYTMAMITDGLSPEGCTPLPAVYVLSSLYRHSRHGDTRHAALAQSLLTAAAQPWWNMVYAWTTMGLLQDDPHHEFFITSAPQQHLSTANNVTGGSQQNSSINSHHHAHNDDRLMWHFGYHLDENKIPEGMLDLPLLTLALNVGKGINFIRKCLSDTEWTLRWDVVTTTSNTEITALVQTKHNQDSTTDSVNSRSVAATNSVDLPQHLGFYHRTQRSSSPGSLNAPVLHQTLRSASEQVHSHILHVLIEDHHLFHHLWALKQFLFLGQGDFISSLIEALQQAELEQNTLMRSTFEDNDRWSHVFQKQALMAIMDGALKSSNAKDLPLYVLERLQIQFVFPVASSKSFVAKDATESGCEEITENVARDNFGDFSNQIGGGLWDGLVLEYIVPDQLVSIVHPEAVATYRMVFQFLFGLKVVEYRLDATWRQSAAIQHALQIHCQNNGIRVANNVGYSQATVLLRNISITREAMIHLVRNLKSYVMLDVLEGGWKDLVQRVEAGSTLDHVIDAHQIYLQDIVRKCWMLRTDSSANTDSSITSTISTTDIDSKAKRQWKKLLCLVNEFCAFQEEIFTESLQAAQFASEKRREADKRKDGNWVFQQEATEEETFFFLADTSKLLSVIRMSEAFHQGVTDLLASLHSKINSPGDQLADDYEQGGSNSGLCEGQTDLDSLRFLTFQLDCNNYYGSIMSS